MKCHHRDYLIRPPKEAIAAAARSVGGAIILRLGLNGQWAPDNGEPGLAFTAGHMGYYPRVPGPWRACGWDCTARLATGKACERTGAGNGVEVTGVRRRRAGNGQREGLRRR
jgi:hypothetical protein